MFKDIKSLHFLVAILVAVFTTGWMRVHLIPWGPEYDGAHYTFWSQYIYYLLSTGQNISIDIRVIVRTRKCLRRRTRRDDVKSIVSPDFRPGDTNILES